MLDSNNLNQINENTEKKNKVVEQNLPQEENQQIEAGVKSKEIQTDVSFTTSMEQENAELKQINTKLAKKIAELNQRFKKANLIKKNSRMMINKCHTGLACFNTLMTLFNLVKPAIKKGKLLNPFEKFMLCMMRLRLGIPVIDLADRFQISKTTAADTFLNVLDILYVKISPLIKWPYNQSCKHQWQCVLEISLGAKLPLSLIALNFLLIDQPI